jgi:predicted RNA binding protein YcfA (HicA-like mRNA interferase family)
MRWAASPDKQVEISRMELNRKKVISRLEREGWNSLGGKEHDKFRHPLKPGVVIVPRHSELTMGVARSIAKAAGWMKS